MNSFTVLYTFTRDFYIELDLFQSFPQGFVWADHWLPRHLWHFLKVVAKQFIPRFT